ncbi:MAG TPA: XRE family transcriptional regulator [Clostridiales bacterium]|nr:XRE family transcriptional regulator [Clostridiales bacterium]
MNFSQKEFADYLGIPRPSLSGYENNRNSPTADVLINIAQKCNVSLDWLCGLSKSTYTFTTISDVVSFLYRLFEINEIEVELEVHDQLPQDIETETERWYTRFTIYGNNCNYEYNATLCSMIALMKNNILDLESYCISKETYEVVKAQLLDMYNEYPVTQKEYPNLNYLDRLDKRREFLELLKNKNAEEDFYRYIKKPRPGNNNS